MNREKVKQIVSEAFDLEPDQRDAFVRRACGQDQSLLAEALSLLDAASNAGEEGFLSSRAKAAADLQTTPDERGKAGTATLHAIESPQQFGRYKVLERIGEGGMGIVYRAEQRVPMRREVVVKVIKLGMDTKLVIARFEAERQALAMMDHPHIAKVYDAGTDDRGRPYFVMEYVKGTPILDYCDRNHLTVDQRLELFMQVCQAIQHAHHKGIIHRDIKPSNILVSTQDGKAFSKVIDFGIAKATNQRLTDRTMFTEHVNMIGTPSYMSPEQADGNIDIDTRTDVYSLGVVLYELLTGRTPFDAGRLKSVALNEMARIIREEDPPKPSTRVGTSNIRPAVAGSLSEAKGEGANGDQQTLATIAKARGSSPDVYAKSLQGEVDWIVMKSIEKDRARRYATPNELAEDVERYLNNQPIFAAPPSIVYQARKFARKYRAPVAAGLAIAGILVVAVALVSALAIKLAHQVAVTRAALVDAEAARAQESLQHKEADRQRQEADRQRGSAQSAARSAKYEAARNQANYLVSQELLDQALLSAKEAYRLGGNWQDGLLLSQIVNESRKTWHLEHSIPITEQPICAAICQTQIGMVMVVAFPSSLAEYDLKTGQLMVQARPLAGVLHLIPFRGPQAQIVATTSNSVQVLSLNGLATLKQHDFGTLGVMATDCASSSIALTLSDHTTQVYSSDLVLLGSQPWPKGARLNDNQPLEKLSMSPDGRWVVSSGVTWWDDCLFWHVADNKTFVHGATGQSLRFIDSPKPIDNPKLYAVAESASFGTALHLLSIDPVRSTLDSTFICTFPSDDTGNFFAHATAARDGIYLPGTSGYAAVTFGTASGAYANVVSQRYASLLGRDDLSPIALALAADASQFAMACTNRILVFDQSHAPTTDWSKGHAAALGASALYTIEPDQTSLYLRITPADPQRPTMRRRLASLPIPDLGWTSIACGAAVSKDQRTLAVRYTEAFRFIVVGGELKNHKVAIYGGLDPVTGRPSGTAPVEIRLITQDENAANAAREYGNERILQLSPDGGYLLVGTRLTVAELYRTADGNLVRYFPPGQLTRLVTSIGNSEFFADAGMTGDSIRLISWKTGNVEREIKLPGKVTGLCGAAGGGELLARIDEGTLARFDVKTGATVRRFVSNLMPVDCSPDGKVFIGFHPDGGAGARGSELLADGQTGSILAVLAHGARPGTMGQFTSDSQSFMLEGHDDVADLVRNLSPEATDRMLDESNGQANLPPEPPTIELPPVRVVAVAPAESAVGLSEIIDATDLPKLTACIGKKDITVQGTTQGTGLTRANNALILGFGEPGKCFVIYVPPQVYPALNARFGGSALTALNHKLIRVKGTLIPYNQMPEIKLTDADQIQVIDPGPTTAPSE